MYPASIRTLIDFFSKFPGIGERSATRFVFFLLRLPPKKVQEFATALSSLHTSILTCSTCSTYADKNPCRICSDASRDLTILCVVSNTTDVNAFERTGQFRGRYHVLGGTISVVEGITPDQLRIKELIGRITSPDNTIKEIILGMNPDIEGESTVLYLGKLLKQYPVKVTKIARGLPRGADIEYADEITLSDALRARWEV